MSLDSFKTDNGSHRRLSSSQRSMSKVKFNEYMKEPTEELGYIIGVILGDASVSEKQSGGRSITLKVVDKDFVAYFAEMFCTWASLKWDGFGSDDTDMTCGVVAGSTENSKDMYYVTKGINSVYQFLNQYQEGNYRVNNLLDKPDAFRVSLLRGLYDSEGSIIERDGVVSFSTTDKKITKLYMRLVSDLVGVNLNNGWNWASDKESGRRMGEFYIAMKSNFGARTIRFPRSYTYRFYRIVDPTIERKRRVFKKHISKHNQSTVKTQNQYTTPKKETSSMLKQFKSS